MSVLVVCHETAHMQAKLVALSYKRVIGIVLSFETFQMYVFYSTTGLLFPLFLSLEIHKISYININYLTEPGTFKDKRYFTFFTSKFRHTISSVTCIVTLG